MNITPTHHAPPDLHIVRTNRPPPTPGPPAPTAPSPATPHAQAPSTAAAKDRRRRSRRATRRKVRVTLHSPNLLKTRWGKWRNHPPGSFDNLLTSYHKAQSQICSERTRLSRQRSQETAGPNRGWWAAAIAGSLPAMTNRQATHAGHKAEFYRLRALGFSYQRAASWSGHYPHRAQDDGRSPYA